MIVTNKLGLPLPFVKMASSDYKPKPKRYSVTTLLNPVREILLKRRYDDELEQDCSDMIWLLFGQAVHSILEKNADGESEFAEEWLSVKLSNGYTVSGIIDLYDMQTSKVVDYKTASVWKVVYKDFEDWRKQGLMYAWLLRKNGLPCSKIEFYAILKDHSKADAKYKSDYPKTPVYKVEFAVTDESIAEIDRFINDKINELAKYEEKPDDELPLCSAEDRWNSGDKYAVMRKGRKTALRVLDSIEEAEKYKAENGGDYIEERKGVDKKCLDYCLCCEKCSHYQNQFNKEN